MADIKLVEKGYFYDFSIDNNGMVESDADIRTSVLISIFSDRRAQDGDEVVDGDRKGWWGDTYNESKIGSRLWTLRRRKATLQTLRLANDIVKESLQWLIDDGIASDVVVNNEWSLINRGRMNMLITISKPDGTDVDFNFNEQWGVDA